MTTTVTLDLIEMDEALFWATRLFLVLWGTMGCVQTLTVSRSWPISISLILRSRHGLTSKCGGLVAKHLAALASAASDCGTHPALGCSVQYAAAQQRSFSGPPQKAA